MSGTPKSPPISPAAGTNQNALPITPMLNDFKNFKLAESQEPTKVEPVPTQEAELANGNEEQEIQVPATNPSNRNQSAPRTHCPEPIVTPEPEVHPPAAQLVAVKKPEQQDDNRELEPYDWEDLQDRYTKELREVNNEQVKILEDFDKFAEAFSNWSQVATQRDTERATKRLKTRERYVQLAEHKLEEKREHYIEVVEAFKKALALLRR